MNKVTLCSWDLEILVVTQLTKKCPFFTEPESSLLSRQKYDMFQVLYNVS
jgi:hypothetical protein